jgi:hypothetical protein
MYAVNLADYATLSTLHPLRFLLRPFLTEQTVEINRQRVDGVGVVVNEQPDGGQDWQAALIIAQSQPMPGKPYPLRIYQRKDGRWQAIRPIPEQFGGSDKWTRNSI